MKRRRLEDPIAFGRVLRPLLRSLRRRGGGDRGAVERAWRVVVGPDLARRTRVAGIEDGCLMVEVSSAALKHHLSTFARQELLDRLRKALPHKHLRDVRYRVGEVPRS